MQVKNVFSQFIICLSTFLMAYFSMYLQFLWNKNYYFCVCILNYNKLIKKLHVFFWEFYSLILNIKILKIVVFPGTWWEMDPTLFFPGGYSVDSTIFIWNCFLATLIWVAIFSYTKFLYVFGSISALKFYSFSLSSQAKLYCFNYWDLLTYFNISLG